MEPYARWCERSANQLMVSHLLDYGEGQEDGSEKGYIKSCGFCKKSAGFTIYILIIQNMKSLF